MDNPLAVAAVRGVISAVVAAGVAFFTVGQADSPETGLWAAGAAFFTTLALRVGVEGTIDQKRSNGNA